MPPRRPSRPGHQQLAQASSLCGLLGHFCTASKALLDAVDAGKRTFDEAYVDGITSTLEELEPTAAALDDKGRSALFVALLNSINAALRLSAPRTATATEIIVFDMSAKRLCMTATRCAKNMVDFSLSGAFMQTRQHRDDAVVFAATLLASDALHSFAQRLAEASAAALDELLRFQRKQQAQQHTDQRPMGQELQLQQQQPTAAAGAAAAGARKQDKGAPASSGSGCNGDSSSSLDSLVLARNRVEQWLPTVEELGVLIHIVVRDDPYSPKSARRQQLTNRLAGLAAAAPAGPPLEPDRPPPIHALFDTAVATSGILEHAARAMATVALLGGTTEQRQQHQGIQHAAGGGVDINGTSSWDRRNSSTYSIWAIEVCASLLQRLSPALEPVDEMPAISNSSSNSGSQHNYRGSSSSSSSKAAPIRTRPAGPSSSTSPSPDSHGGALPATPHSSLGPWCRYVLTCLGLRCLHGLDGGSCYGMPRELVAGLPHMVAPGTLTCDPETRELGRTVMTPEYDAVACIHVLAPMLRLMLSVERLGFGGRRERTAMSYGTGARGMGPDGGGHRNAAARLGSAGVMGLVEAVVAGQDGDGHGGREVWWPCVGPKAARDISRRVVAWAVGLARGWVADEDGVHSAGGGGAGVGGYSPWEAADSAKNMLVRAKETVGQLTLLALRVYGSTLEVVVAGGGAAAGAGGGREGGAGDEADCGVGVQRRQGKSREQQHQALLAEWYGLACGVASHAVHWPAGDHAGGNLAELMALGLPPLTHTGELPPLPPPRLAAALSGGYLPCLDTLLRRCGRRFAPGDVVMAGLLLIADGSFGAATRLLGRPGGGENFSSSSSSSSSSNSGLVFGYCHELPYLLAYGSPRQSASLLASMAKVLRRAARDDDPRVGCGGASCTAAPGAMAAAPGDGAEEVVADGLASMLCRGLGAAFAWMQGAQQPDGCRRRPYRTAAATAASVGGNPPAGGGSSGQKDLACGAASSWHAGPQRLRLLLSFALARVVPPLSAFLIRQCRRLPKLLAEARARAGGGRSLCPGDDPQTHLAGSLQHLLAVLLVAQRTAWRCRYLVSSSEAGGTGAGTGKGSRGRGSGAPGGAAAAEQQGELGVGAVGAVGAAELSALADGLQGLLDGDVDSAGLVGAALDCLQLLPASHRGHVAAAVLELCHCALWICQHDMGSMRLPDGSRFLCFNGASPIVKDVLWSSSSSAEKLRAAVAAARCAGYAAEAEHGDALVVFASRQSPGCHEREAPEVPLWLLTPSEVGRELGGSYCCNARCTRLEGDSEAGEGQWQGQGLLVCGRCRGAWYCCRECQAADWGAGHKKACRGK